MYIAWAFDKVFCRVSHKVLYKMHAAAYIEIGIL